tara:strand:- start:94 stop:546 length:453 start_codon:yes stop_codon:yes gene_type:complete
MFIEVDELERQFSALVIFDDGEKILLLLRPDEPDVKFPNMWSIPGGGSKKGERPHQTAFREAYEETGLRVDFRSLKEIAVTQTDGKNVYFFKAEKWSGKVNDESVKSEHENYRWVPYSKLKDYNMPPNNLELIQKNKTKYLKEVRILIKR